MQKYQLWVWVAAALGAVLAGGGNRAAAQPRQALSSSGTYSLAPSSFYEERELAEIEERRAHPMGWTGAGLKIGMAGMSSAQLSVERKDGLYRGHIDSRRGLHIALPIQLGGSEFSWTIEPYLSRSSVGSPDPASGADEVDLTSYGFYTGPHYQFHVRSPLYLGVGLGFKAAYVNSPGFDHGADAYLRLPLSATYYVNRKLAMVAELGLGYGASVLGRKNPQVTVDVATGDSEFDDTPLFGTAFAWDCSIGVRLP